LDFFAVLLLLRPLMPMSVANDPLRDADKIQNTEISLPGLSDFFPGRPGRRGNK
jgi:hypothetical protein